MTVSNVLNGTGRVSQGTKARVEASIAALNYNPNLAARRLVGSRLSRLGVIYLGLESVFLNAVVAALSTQAAARGLQLMLRPLPKATRLSAVDAAQEVVRSGAEGIILIPPIAELLGQQGRLKAFSVPVVALATAGPLPGAATVRIDNVAAAREMTQLLIRQGRTRIGVIVGPLDHSDSVARLQGHRDALHAYGLEPDAGLEVPGQFTFASGVAAAERLLALQPPPTAIVAANDDMAAGALWAANQRGIRVPDQLAVTGFDDTLLATRVWPTLTTVRQPLDTMAGEALDILGAAFRTPGPAHNRDVVVDFELIERGSTVSVKEPAPQAS